MPGVIVLVAGIDGGQSSTIAVVADDRGWILGRGTSGPADEIGVTAESTRLRDALAHSLEVAVRNANLPGHTHFDAIVAGISGYDGTSRGRLPELPAERVELMHDAPIAHAGALAGHPGVVVIAGSGSVVYARDSKGSSVTLGGWGFLFGDEGSAFRIACESLTMLMRAQDAGDLSLSEPVSAAREFFGQASLRELAHAFYSGELTRDKLASFAPTAMTFEVFRGLVNQGADRLAALACDAIRAGFPARVALSGGVFTDAAFAQRVRAGIRDRVSGSEVLAPRYEPAAGAVLLAYRELGLEIEELRG